jgi:serine/threonine protein kinase
METGAQVAIKILDKGGLNKQNMASQIKKEISLMKRIEHRNVVRLIEVLASKTKVFIVLELVTGGELFDVIKAHGKLEETVARRYFRQLIEGVQHGHMQVSLALVQYTCTSVYSHYAESYNYTATASSTAHRDAKTVALICLLLLLLTTATATTAATAATTAQPNSLSATETSSQRTCCWMLQATSRSVTLGSVHCRQKLLHHRKRGCCAQCAALLTTWPLSCSATEATTAALLMSGAAALCCTCCCVASCPLRRAA